MNQKTKREILLLGAGESSLQGFADFLKDFYEVSVYASPKELAQAASYENSVIVSLMEGQYEQALKECRELCKQERIIGVYDGDFNNYINEAVKLNLNGLLSFNLTQDKTGFARMLNLMFRQNTAPLLNMIVSKNAKVLKARVGNIQALYPIISKISSFISQIRKISPETLLTVLTPIVNAVSAMNKEMELIYALEKNRLGFILNIKHIPNPRFPSEFYQSMYTETPPDMEPLKESVLNAFREADESVLLLKEHTMEYYFAFYLRAEHDLGKSFSLPGDYTHYNKPSKEETKQEETASLPDMSKGEIKDDFESYLSETHDNIVVVDIKKKEEAREELDVDLQITLPDIDYENQSPAQIIKKLEEQNKMLKDKVTELAKKFHEANLRMKKAEEVADVIGEEIKILMRQRKEPTTDQELKEIKSKLEQQMDGLYREIGVEKAKSKKLIKQLDLLKQELLAARMEKDKLSALIREKDREISELDSQLSLAIKSSSDF
ncbi:MAG: hypothetical protein JXA66_01040 [Oligoflexia bacterium]|nr:hypothetical protein [Oligoflexia bacterium]